MCGFSCSPNGKKACKPSWCLSGLTSSTLKMKCKVRPKAFPSEVDGLAHGGRTFWLNPFYLE